MTKPALALAVALTLAGVAAQAQVPPDIAAGNRAIGKANDQPATFRLYGPLAQKPPYADAKITRDLAYGPGPRNLLDVFQPTAAGKPRAVVIYFSGGISSRTSGDTRAASDGGPAAPGPFYDNIMLWAARHDLIGINTDRARWQGAPWDAGTRDVAAAVNWARANVGRYGGDPDRIFLFGHGYGGSDVSTYLAHPEFWDGRTPGVKGAILISAPLNIAPLMGPPGARAGNPMFEAAHSNLEGLKASAVPLYMGSAEMGEDGTNASADLLRLELCRKTCPAHDVYRDHGHISVTYSFNTTDETVSGAVLKWIRGVR